MQERQIKISVLFIAVFMYGLYMVKLLTIWMLFYP